MYCNDLYYQIWKSEHLQKEENVWKAIWLSETWGDDLKKKKKKTTSRNYFGHVWGSLVRGTEALELCWAETYDLCELDFKEVD